MKKIIAMILVLVMALSLVACSNQPADPTKGNDPKPTQGGNDPQPTNAPEKPAYPISDEPITIKVAVVGQDMTNPSRMLYELIAEFTNVNIELINIEKDQFGVYLASNEWPDMFMEGFSAGDVYEYGILGQMLVNYQDYMDIMPNVAKMFEDYPDAYRMSIQEDGGIYALPHIEYSSTLTETRVHYNALFFEEHNLEEPTTLDEWYNLLVKIRDLNNGAAPVALKLNRGDKYLHAFTFPAFGEYAVLGFTANKDGKVLDTYTTEQYREYLKYMHKLYDEGLIHKEYTTLDNNAILGLLQNGSAIFFGEVGSSVTSDMFADGKYHIGTLSPLVMNEGDTPKCVAVQPVRNSYSFVINANSPYVEEICKWVDIAYSTEEVYEGTGISGNSFTWGPTGLTFHPDEASGTYIQTMPDSDAEMTPKWRKDNIVIGQYGLSDTRGLVEAGDTSAAHRSKGYRDKVVPYCTVPAYPAVVFTSAEQEVRDQYLTEQESYKVSMSNKFIMGVEDINDDAVWANYLKMMETYGTEELVKIYQSAYDRYYEN